MLSNKRVSTFIAAAELKEFAQSRWGQLNNMQKNILIKSWKMITYKWQWQIALNSVFLLVWLLDANIQAVHNFDLKIMALLPIKNWFKTFLGINKI